MASELLDAFDEIDGDRTVGSAVIRGDGGHFCAGGDRQVLAWIGENPTDSARYDALTAIYACFERLGRLAVPTVAAVRGAVVGAGMNLMMATDLRVVARNARIISGFQRIGLHPGGGHYVLSGRLAGAEAATALAIFGAEIDGDRAREIGLAWEAVSDDEVDDRALELAAEPARDPDLARRSIALLRRELGPPMVPWDVAVDAERSVQMWSMQRGRGLSPD
jgi:enoyl-CoA hydratase